MKIKIDFSMDQVSDSSPPIAWGDVCKNDKVFTTIVTLKFSVTL